MKTLGIVFFVVILLCARAAAQTTEFTYQGNLRDGLGPANGNYDLEFRLYDAITDGTQVGSTLARSNAAVANGSFSIALDFGNVFPGAERYLEIGVRTAGGGSFTVLAPRQKVGTSPYAIRSVASESATVAVNAVTANNATTANNALQLGGVAANQFVFTTDPRMSDTRPPTAGSANYVQNTTTPQASSSFNITGNGTVAGTLSSGVVNAVTQYNMNGNRVLTLGNGGGTFVGVGAGAATTNGGSQNSFFGFDAGFSNQNASSSSFFGYQAGRLSTGFGNSFFGASAGSTNTSGDSNTLIGRSADVGSSNLSFATAIGANAVVSTNNTVVLGRTADTVRVPGNFLTVGQINTNSNLVVAGTSALDGILRVTGGTDAEPGNNGGYIVAGASILGPNLVIDDNEIMARDTGGTATLFLNADGGNVSLIQGGTGNVGIGVAGNPLSKLHVDGNIRFTQIGAAGDISLCYNVSQQISYCSSSLRYKTNINRFGQGLDLINQLKPITFDWKDGGMHDLGLGAEDVAAIEPLLVTYNKDGQVEGVKYDRVGVVLVNAVKEQQSQIDAQQKEIAERKATEQKMQSQIDELRKIVCSLKPDADGCSL